MCQNVGRGLIHFKIDQLRKDKNIYAIEACAMTLICMFVYADSTEVMGDGSWSDIARSGAFILAVGYTLYMGVGNFYRLARVKKLERELKNS